MSSEGTNEIVPERNDDAGVRRVTATWLEQRKAGNATGRSEGLATGAEGPGESQGGSEQDA